LLDAVQLMAWFGTLGSRARNGWGALHLTPEIGTPQLSTVPGKTDRLLSRIGRQWTDCLQLDWPHALGLAGHAPLVWLSEPYPDWRKVMGCLANVRVEVRRVAKSFVGPEGIGGIHLLGYPAGGKWELGQLKKGRPDRNYQEGRLATQLRFKVLGTPKGLVGMAFHMPHRFPSVLSNRLGPTQQRWLLTNERLVWEQIHKALNQGSRLAPLGAVQ